MTASQSVSKCERGIQLLTLIGVFTGFQIGLNIWNSVLKPQDYPLCSEGSHTRKTQVISRRTDSPSYTIYDPICHPFLKKPFLREFPGGPVVRTPWFPSLVGELRSCKPCGAEKKNLFGSLKKAKMAAYTWGRILGTEIQPTEQDWDKRR